MAYSAIDIANKILSSVASDSGDLISNMKLQKMLYYQQGFHLAFFKTPLFEEEIEAWMYGPVVPAVYEHFKEYGNQGIEYKDTPIELTIEEERLFDNVCRVYNKYSAIGLMEMTHEEAPWKSTHTGVGQVISKDKLTSFFKKRLK